VDDGRNIKSSAVARERDSGASFDPYPPLTWMGYFLPSRKGGATQRCNLLYRAGRVHCTRNLGTFLESTLDAPGAIH
jgi:hypothetical protein